MFSPKAFRGPLQPRPSSPRPTLLNLHNCFDRQESKCGNTMEPITKDHECQQYFQWVPSTNLGPISSGWTFTDYVSPVVGQINQNGTAYRPITFHKPSSQY